MKRKSIFVFAVAMAFLISLSVAFAGNLSYWIVKGGGWIPSSIGADRDKATISINLKTIGEPRLSSGGHAGTRRTYEAEGKFQLVDHGGEGYKIHVDITSFVTLGNSREFDGVYDPDKSPESGDEMDICGEIGGDNISVYVRNSDSGEIVYENHYDSLNLPGGHITLIENNLE